MDQEEFLERLQELGEAVESGELPEEEYGAAREELEGELLGEELEQDALHEWDE